DLREDPVASLGRRFEGGVRPARRSGCAAVERAGGLSMMPNALAAAMACGLLVASPDAGQSAATQDRSVRPFKAQVPQAVLDELRARIAATRWPDKETVGDPSQGPQLARVQELVRYWGSGYDWRKAEARLNALPQFTTSIDGV